MNKLSMRARKLDNSKPLRVYKTEEIPDLEEQSQYGRSVLQIATGVEKEEEEVIVKSPMLSLHTLPRSPFLIIRSLALALWAPPPLLFELSGLLLSFRWYRSPPSILILDFKKKKKKIGKQIQQNNSLTLSLLLLPKEHHLQAVISASLVDAPNAKDISIPIPDASVKVNHYTSVYTQTFLVPKTLIRSTADAEWNEDYDADADDLEWIQRQNKPTRKITEDQFENVINQFEQLAKETKEIPDTYEAFGQITSQVAAATVADVFKHWKGKREGLKCGSLLYPLKVCDNNNNSNNSNAIQPLKSL